MAYHKLKAEKIFTGTQLLHDHVLITTETGTIIDIISNNEAGNDTEIIEGWLCPGFINVHCHTELSHMKGIVPEQTGMTDFLLKVLFERHAGEVQKQQTIKQAIEEMQQSGIVAVGDICNTADSAEIKSNEKNVFFHNFIEVSGFMPSLASDRFEQGVAVSNHFNKWFPSEQISITPHAAYSVSEKLMRQIASQQQALISIHNQESKAEDDFIRNKKGELLRLYEAIGVGIDFFEPKHRSSLQYILPLLDGNTQAILVHNCLTGKEDLDFLTANFLPTLIHFCLCPNANLYIGNPLPDVRSLMDSGLHICIGTDSLASNHQLNILSELQTLQAHFSFLTVEELLQWATSNGAYALKINDQFGSFEKGKRPGILQLKNVTDNEGLKNVTVTRFL